MNKIYKGIVVLVYIATVILVLAGIFVSYYVPEPEPAPVCIEGAKMCDLEGYEYTCISGKWVATRKLVPTPVPTPTPTPTPVPTPKPMNVKEFMSYVRINWVYEADEENERVPAPEVSFKRLKGDCEDFAVMVAYYMQEVYGYDTFVTTIKVEGRDLHAVAFVAVSEDFLEVLADYCNGISIIRIDDQAYVPFDWRTCPDWEWAEEGSFNRPCYEWYELVGEIL